jgi:hypothetical protein
MKDVIINTQIVTYFLNIQEYLCLYFCTRMGCQVAQYVGSLTVDYNPLASRFTWGKEFASI